MEVRSPPKIVGTKLVAPSSTLSYSHSFNSWKMSCLPVDWNNLHLQAERRQKMMVNCGLFLTVTCGLIASFGIIYGTQQSVNLNYSTVAAQNYSSLFVPQTSVGSANSTAFFVPTGSYYVSCSSFSKVMTGSQKEIAYFQCFTSKFVLNFFCYSAAALIVVTSVIGTLTIKLCSNTKTNWFIRSAWVGVSSFVSFNIAIATFLSKTLPIFSVLYSCSSFSTSELQGFASCGKIGTQGSIASQFMSGVVTFIAASIVAYFGFLMQWLWLFFGVEIIIPKPQILEPKSSMRNSLDNVELNQLIAIDG
jgi:hypothetical protein